MFYKQTKNVLILLLTPEVFNMGYDDDSELAASKQKRAEEIRRQMEQQQAEESYKAQVEGQKRAILQQILTEEALTVIERFNG